MEKRKKGEGKTTLAVLMLALALAVVFIQTVIAVPTGPDTLTSISNETKATTAAQVFNISGGYVSKFNLTGTTQNPRWKAFAGNVTGVFTLDDSTGSTIYDWTLSTVSGEVYATRVSGAIAWATTNCALDAQIVTEDTTMWLTGDDNITSTFASGTNQRPFVVAGNSIAATNCSSTNTYQNNATPAGDEFEEVVLTDGTNIIFSTLIENKVTGYDGARYDFQMIVPDNGSELWTGQLAYYIYVELN